MKNKLITVIFSVKYVFCNFTVYKRKYILSRFFFRCEAQIRLREKMKQILKRGEKK
jgi:hypothetical protein